MVAASVDVGQRSPSGGSSRRAQARRFLRGLVQSRRRCPFCRRMMTYEPHTGTLHVHSLPRLMRPGPVPEKAIRCPAAWPLTGLA